MNLLCVTFPAPGDKTQLKKSGYWTAGSITSPEIHMKADVTVYLQVLDV